MLLGPDGWIMAPRGSTPSCNSAPNLQHLPLTHAFEGLFLSVETCVFVDVDQLFPLFSQVLWQRRSSHHWMKGEDLKILRITLLKQGSFCELSEIAETPSIVYVRVFMLFIYLIVWKHRSSEWFAKEQKFKGTKDITPTRGKSFLWMEAVFENEFLLIILHVIE